MTKNIGIFIFVIVLILRFVFLYNNNHVNTKKQRIFLEFSITDIPKEVILDSAAVSGRTLFDSVYTDTLNSTSAWCPPLRPWSTDTISTDSTSANYWKNKNY